MPCRSRCCVFHTGIHIYEIRVEEQRHAIQTEEYTHLLQMMTPDYNKKGCAAFHSRQESITGESPTSFPEEDTTTPYSGFEPKPTRLQVEGYIHHTTVEKCRCSLNI
ncbi:hypothetical protein TNCV_1541041 [Trichonephila clavipes]|nr:hypothetical protein TNCV_1541041 [Trichonephila clavipes]